MPNQSARLKSWNNRSGGGLILVGETHCAGAKSWQRNKIERIDDSWARSSAQGRRPGERTGSWSNGLRRGNVRRRHNLGCGRDGQPAGARSRPRGHLTVRALRPASVDRPMRLPDRPAVVPRTRRCDARAIPVPRLVCRVDPPAVAIAQVLKSMILSSPENGRASSLEILVRQQGQQPRRPARPAGTTNAQPKAKPFRGSAVEGEPQTPPANRAAAWRRADRYEPPDWSSTAADDAKEPRYWMPSGTTRTRPAARRGDRLRIDAPADLRTQQPTRRSDRLDRRQYVSGPNVAAEYRRHRDPVPCG